jgi:phenylpyruvate tautomerase PptA (4-oxalocrotonate tautomerase family)
MRRPVVSTNVVVLQVGDDHIGIGQERFSKQRGDSVGGGGVDLLGE